MTYEMARKYLENMVALYEARYPMVVSSRDIGVFEVAIAALRQQEKEEDDRK